MKIANLKLTRLIHRAIASYLRAVAAALGSVTIVNAAGHPDLAALWQILIAIVAALIAPLIMFLTEAADLLEATDGTADGSTPPSP